MLRYPCLVLDHDNTVVRSEATVNYPYFCRVLERFRPGQKITPREYTEGCYHLGFVNLCRQYYSFTDQELDAEYLGWLDYVRDHIPELCPGMDRIIRRQKQEGGLVCVLSQSGRENILRDYRAHIGILPDAVYSWDLPSEQRKPSPWALRDIMERYSLSPSRILVVDDMKPACQMAREAGVEIAFAGWSREDFPEIRKEMRGLCDYSFDSTEELEKFLFDSLDIHGIISA